MQVLIFLGQTSESGTSTNGMMLPRTEISISAEVICGFFPILEEFQGWGQRDGKLRSLVASRKGKHLRMEEPLRLGVKSEQRGWGSRWSHLNFSYGIEGDENSSSTRCFSKQQNLIVFTCFTALSLPRSDLTSSCCFQIRFLLVLGQPWIQPQTPTRFQQQVPHQTRTPGHFVQPHFTSQENTEKRASKPALI